MYQEPLEPRRLLSGTVGATHVHPAVAGPAASVQLPGTIDAAQLGAGSTFRTGNNSMSSGPFAGWSGIGSIANYTVAGNGGILSDSLKYSADTSGDAIQVQVDGQNVGNPVNLPSTGGWYNWRQAALPQINLSSGSHVVSLLVTGGNPSVNIQSWNFAMTQAAPPPAPLPPAVPPPTIPPPPAVGSVTGLELLDGTTQKDLGPLVNGQVITESSGQTFAIRTHTSGAIGSIVYNMDGGAYTHTENLAPYDVFGTAADGSSQASPISVGSHTITATPHGSAYGQGAANSVYAVDFSIVQSPPPVTPAPPAPLPPAPPPVGPVVPPANAPPPIAGTWNQVWGDEFNGTSLNPVWHTAQYWDHTTTVVGQGELEAYNAAADTVSGGALHITATPNTSYGAQYLSGLVMTGGENDNPSYPTFNFQYGYMEVRAKIPQGQGLWPAIWMMPASYKDGNGEIDVMENLGQDTTTAYGTVHVHGQQQQHTFHGIDLSQGYHTYAVDWEPDQISWYIDGQLYGTTTNASLIPAEPMYPIINLAAGGTWGGDPNASTRFPATMDIDYIRVWQKA
jgi:hypothetical protein